MDQEITKLKINYATMAEKIDNLCSKVDNIDVKLTTYIAHERARERDMKDNFAGKWVEPLVKMMSVGFALALFGALVAVIFDKL